MFRKVHCAGSRRGAAPRPWRPAGSRSSPTTSGGRPSSPPGTPGTATATCTTAWWPPCTGELVHGIVDLVPQDDHQGWGVVPGGEQLLLAPRLLPVHPAHHARHLEAGVGRTLRHLPLLPRGGGAGQPSTSFHRESLGGTMGPCARDQG